MHKNNLSRMCSKRKLNFLCVGSSGTQSECQSARKFDAVSLNALWTEAYDILDESSIPLKGSRTCIEDPDIILQMYEQAFDDWNENLMRHVCNALFFIFQEANLLPLEYCNMKSIERGKLMVIYMNTCRSSQELANITRKILFPSFRSLLFSRKNTIDKVRKEFIDLEKGFSEVKNKTKLWQSAHNISLNNCVPFNSSFNTFRHNGSVMHIIAGSAIMRDLLIANNLPNFDTFIPGRIISKKLPYLASTPDFCVSLSENSFQHYYEELMNTKVISAKMKPYAPHFWIEIKTLQKVTIDSTKLQKLYTLQAEMGLAKSIVAQSLAVQKCKTEAIHILTNTFLEAGWMSNESKSRVSPIEILMQRKSLIVPHNLAQRCKHFEIRKSRLKHLFGSDTSHVEKLSVLPLIQSGRAWIFMYKKDKFNEKCELSLEFESAPFILGPMSSFYVQITEQICCVQYLNSAAKFLFVVITKHTAEHSDDDNRPCLAYVYEVIIPDCIRLQYEKECFCVANKYLDSSIPFTNAGEKILNHLFWNDNDYDSALCTLSQSKEFIDQNQAEEINNTFNRVLHHKFYRN